MKTSVPITKRNVEDYHEPAKCRRCDILVARDEKDYCDPCRVAEAAEILARFVEHEGNCWRWNVEPEDLGSGCNELRRLETILAHRKGHKAKEPKA